MFLREKIFMVSGLPWRMLEVSRFSFARKQSLFMRRLEARLPRNRLLCAVCVIQSYASLAFLDVSAHINDAFALVAHTSPPIR